MDGGFLDLYAILSTYMPGCNKLSMYQGFNVLAYIRFQLLSIDTGWEVHACS